MIYGAIIGDIVGSTRELHNEKSEDIELFPNGSCITDDSVMTVAVADKLLNDKYRRCNNRKAYAMWYKQYYRKYPGVGYGQMFNEWVNRETIRKQRSYANGAAMRVCAIGYACADLKNVWKEVKDSCYYTHNNREAIIGAKAVATAVYLANKQEEKEQIKRYIERKFKYKFVKLDEIRETYEFDSRTLYSVPPALEAFFESDSYESAIRKAVSIGGDSDTIACITGGIAEAYYKEIPNDIMSKAFTIMGIGFKRVIEDFMNEYNGGNNVNTIF